MDAADRIFLAVTEAEEEYEALLAPIAAALDEGDFATADDSEAREQLGEARGRVEGLRKALVLLELNR